MNFKILEFQVDKKNHNQRIDRFLSNNLDYSRNQIKNMILSSKIFYNGRFCKPNKVINQFDFITVNIDYNNDNDLKPRKIDLDIIHEDDDIIVINKPANLTVHPGAGKYQKTLVEGLMYHSKNLSDIDKQRPGIVHRLDKNTTGLMVCAKNNFSHLNLAKQFEQKTSKRSYIALLDGYLSNKKLIIDNFITRDFKNKIKFKAIDKNKINDIKFYKNAKSIFYKKNTYKKRLTLAKIDLHTGRTHQIRVHAKFINLPVIGDMLYHMPAQIPKSFPKEIRAYFNSLDYQLLHAYKLSFDHPKSKKKLCFKIKLPDNFKKTLEILKLYQDDE